MYKVSEQNGEPLPTLLLRCTQDTFAFLGSVKVIPQFWYLVPTVAQSKLEMVSSLHPALTPLCSSLTKTVVAWFVCMNHILTPKISG